MAKEKVLIDKFQQGYLCAVSALIQMHEGVDSQTKELFTSGAGKYDIKKLRAWGVDEYDIQIFKKYKKELM